MNINQHFDMVALSPTNHRQALETALQIFRHDPTAKEDIREAYKRALYPERYLNQGKRAYWLLVDKKTKRIAGTIGLYTQGPDRKEPYGLGWFGVSDEFRSLGLGKYLLQWVLDEVKRRNKSVLRIETSDLSYATTAVALYKRFGCVQIAKIPQMKHHRILYNKLILEKRLVHGRAFSDYKKNGESKQFSVKDPVDQTFREIHVPFDEKSHDKIGYRIIFDHIPQQMHVLLDGMDQEYLEVRHTEHRIDNGFQEPMVRDNPNVSS